MFNGMNLAISLTSMIKECEISEIQVKKMEKKLLISTYFQPIISIKDKRIVALEALSRFCNTENGPVLSAGILIEECRSREELLKLDWQMLRTAIKSFSLLPAESHCLLFMNVSAPVVNGGASSVQTLLNYLAGSGISPQRVVLEILEDDLEMSERDWEFFRSCRQAGIFLALDDIGVGFSNLERIALIKPDIIKLDRSLVQNISSSFHKRKVFESLIKLAGDIGAIALAEGVETLEESLAALESGAKLLQGFHFCRPQPSLHTIEMACSEKILDCRHNFKNTMTLKKQNYRRRLQVYEKAVEMICTELVSHERDMFEQVMNQFIHACDDIECLYILNRDGIQVTDTVTVFQDYLEKHYLFQPAIKGADHSLKMYFFEPQGHQQLQVSEPYISQASGKSCITISKAFMKNGFYYLLCADFPDQV